LFFRKKFIVNSGLTEKFPIQASDVSVLRRVQLRNAILAPISFLKVLLLSGAPKF